MIIRNKEDFAILEEIHLKECCICGQSLEYPFIYWMMQVGHILSHAECASDLCVKIDLEAKEIKGEI